MSEFGLTGLRDANGERKPVKHTFEWGEQDVTIKFVPPTISETEEIEELLDQEELDADEIQQPLDKFLEEPSLPAGEDWTLREFNCYLQGIYSWTMGHGDSFAAEVADELEKRAGAEGN